MRMAGYAAIFDAPDHGGDIVRKGAFARAAKAGLQLLWQHDTARRIGRCIMAAMPQQCRHFGQLQLSLRRTLDQCE